jgi:hypothetical protein
VAYFETKRHDMYTAEHHKTDISARKIGLADIKPRYLSLAYDFVSSLLYNKYPQHFTWEYTRKHWKLRHQTTAALNNGLWPRPVQSQIGRVYTVSPTHMECYYLRLLLHDQRMAAAMSFDKMRYTMIGGVADEHVTYEATAIALGLCENDQEWILSMEQANETASSPQLRRLFVVILIHAHPADPLALWQHCRDWMCEDIAYSNPNMPYQEQHNLCLGMLAVLLEKQGESLAKFRLPNVPPCHMGSSDMIDHELRYDPVSLQATLDEPLLPHQQDAFNKFKHAYDNHVPWACFLNAVAGAGKTKFLNYVLAHVRSQGDMALAVATSGIAALLLHGGRTPNSRFKTGIHHGEDTYCDIDGRDTNPLVQLLRAVRVIVWDEAPMAHRTLFETIHRSLCDIRGTEVATSPLFGGVILILAGDFRQNLPVVRRGTRSQVVAASLKTSRYWHNFEVIKWELNVRSMLRMSDVDTEQYATFIESIGNDTRPTDSDGYVELPARLSFPRNTTEDLIDHMYNDLPNIHATIGGNWESAPGNSLTDFSTYLSERAILTPTNMAANDLNLQVKVAYCA